MTLGFSCHWWNELDIQIRKCLSEVLFLGTLWDSVTPSAMAQSSWSVPLSHRCKEEARRACRAGKKQLVSLLTSFKFLS